MSIKGIFGFVVVAALAAGGYTLAVVNWSYSSGEHAGWVQKFSRKGWLCKTWEGEMAMVTMPGTTSEKFYFTVWDDDVAAEINKIIGKRVALHYLQKVGIPSSCFGDTRFYITKVTRVEEIPLVPGVVVPTKPAEPAEPEKK